MTHTHTVTTLRQTYGDDLILAAAKQIITEKYSYGKTITSAKHAASYFIQEFAHDTHERFVVLFLNSKHAILAIETVFTGTIDQCAVYPRSVVQKCLQHNASAVIFAHNHPSGDPEPSQADIEITVRLKQSLALIDVHLLDHIVVGGAQTCSLAERGCF